MRVPRYSVDVLVLVVAAAVVLGSPAIAQPSRALGWLKNLEGNWEGTFSWSGGRSGSGDLTASYSSTGNGSAVVENLTFGGKVTMLSVYHADGEDLRMTHYCAAGNQPRLKAATVDESARRIRFEFVDATNLADPSYGHVHGVEMLQKDDDSLSIRFIYLDEGQESYEDISLRRIREDAALGKLSPNEEAGMVTSTPLTRVTGIGGVFFKADDPKALLAWYQKHLGFDATADRSVMFGWREAEDPETMAYTVWGPFPRTTRYFEPSTAPFMFNYRVADLDSLLATLRSEGVDVEDRIEEYDYGRFAWIMDPEGNRIELWEPTDKEPY